MFIYLSKKIAIPNNTRINCLAWNKEQGYIAVGGNDGMLKVLKLDAGGDQKMKGIAAPSNLSMNQTLEGHSGEVQVIIWNEIHQKLTTSDQYGLIIVWMLYKGSWYEEMINNRNKSVVKGMSWSSDGQKICIVYEDGAVIVGSVDGNRIWGKEMKGTRLSGVQWAPHGKSLLFGLQNGEVHIYDNQGNFTVKLEVQFSPMIVPTSKMIVGLDWYDGRQGLIDENCPVLVICYHSGHMQLMRTEFDDSPIIIDTNMRAVCCKWNHNGSVIAVVGSMVLPSENKDSNVIQFFTPFGEHIRTLKVPGESVTCCVWEGNSLRVALSVDSHIYFANIRPDYKWTSMNNGRVVVYSYNRANKQGTSVCFWDTRKNEMHLKHVSGLLGMAAYSGCCVLALRTDDDKIFKLQLCNSISTLIDSVDIDIEPLWMAINSTHVFVASKNNFLMWGFKIPKLHSTILVNPRRCKMFHADDIPCGVADVIQDLDASYVPAKDTFATADPICCIAASDRVLLVARESGVIQHYALPHVALTVRHSVHSRPYNISINCDSTKYALIDISGVLTFQTIEESNEFSLKSQIPVQGTKVERRDVWALCWAVDNPTLVATMEKTRMYILRNDEPEEPIISAGYICSFKDLEIRAVLLDELMKTPDQPTAEHIMDLEVKSLRDTRELLDKVGIPEATTFIEDNPHPVLWKLLAEAALQKMDLKTAESAFVRFSDYQGLQFVKRLQNIHSDNLRKAEVSAYMGDYNETEKIYLEMERIDLAIQLRERLGDYFRVAQLMKNGGSSSDLQFEKTYNAIGDYYVDRHNWKSAKEYYEKSKNIEKELICAYMMEDWESLKMIANNLTEKHPLLNKIGQMLQNVGMCKQAVDVFVKADDVASAIECCISLSQWSEAIRLAVKHQQAGVSKLLAANAKQLIDSGKILEAIDFLCKAQQFLEAAKFMFMVAEDEAKKKRSPLHIKKLYVLAALMLEEKQKNKIGELSTLLEADTTSGALVDPWRRAEAYHFLMLAQHQLHQGYVDAAMKTALNLRSYEDILDVEEIYCLIALSAAASHHYSTCSKALCRLEALPEVSPERRSEYEALALDLFSRNSPRDPKGNRVECSACLTMIGALSDVCPNCKTRFSVCVATGSQIIQNIPTWTCTVCHHKAIAHDAAIRKSCALCHALS